MAQKMISQLRNFIHSNSLTSPGEKILIAVSGGIDSVVLTHMLNRIGIDFSIAHCNFGLRGLESDIDELFVRDIAQYYKVDFYIRKFNPEDFNSIPGNSIQMQARHLRYMWFLELLNEAKFNKIAIAHNKNDNTETVFLNLIKGAFWRGLQGIKVKNGNIIRPLIWASRSEIEEYARYNKLSYRLDSSNMKDKYIRNNLRLNIIPLIRKINSDLDNTIYQSSIFRQYMTDYFENNLIDLKSRIIKHDGNKLIINREDLIQINPAVLFSIIEDYGFTFSQCQDLFKSLEHNEAKEFLSEKYRMIKQRQNILITDKNESFNFIDQKINKDDRWIVVKRYKIEFELLEEGEMALSKNFGEVFLDFDKLEFPLKIRNWMPGDKFIPLGMKGSKKVSDYLTDVHADVFDKENQFVITSGSNIVWLVGKRIDERYKVKSTSKKILRIQLLTI
jgi:tRNA(Ile)-lysidine synthase